MSKPDTQNNTAVEKNIGVSENCSDTARNAPKGANDNPKPSIR